MSAVSAGARERLSTLVREFPPAPISSARELEVVQARINALLGRERDEAEEIYLHLLGSMIAEWEDQHEDWPDLPPAELIKVLLEDRGLPQHALVEAGVFPTDSVASEVLSGRRAFRLEHLLGAARFFALPPEVFLPARSTDSSVR